MKYQVGQRVKLSAAYPTPARRGEEGTVTELWDESYPYPYTFVGADGEWWYVFENELEPVSE